SINDGSAELAANELRQTGWYVFDEHSGTERFWLIWSAQRMSELERVKGVVNPKDKGVIRDPDQVNLVREFLARNAKPVVEKDEVKQQTQVRGRGEILVNLIELAHRRPSARAENFR